MDWMMARRQIAVGIDDGIAVGIDVGIDKMVA